MLHIAQDGELGVASTERALKVRLAV
jgi:hypothetical protein